MLRKNSTNKKLSAVILSAIMLLTVIPLFSLILPALAQSGIGIEAGVPSGIAVGDTVYYGTYPQTDLGTTQPPGTDGVDWISASDGKNGGTTHYYKIEPIAWRVLQNAEGKLFLLSEKNLDAGKPYHVDYEGVTWGESTMRSWLNGYTAAQHEGSTAVDYSAQGANFIGRAFSAEEQAAILTTDVVNDNDNNPGNGENGTLTNDKIFLLSIQEAINPAYGFTDNYNATDTRKAVNTGYTAHFSGMYDADIADFWWLRSPGGDPDDAAVVGVSGNVFGGGGSVSIVGFAARPAFNLDLSSVIFTSAAVGGKSLAVPDGDLIPAEPVGNNLKFTIKDSSLTLASVKKTSVNGNTVNFSYTGASIGKTLSAVVLDDSGAVKYYGKLIDNITSASGSATVTVPDSLAATDTMQIFVEECNGDYLTDFASGYKKLNLPGEMGIAVGDTVYYGTYPQSTYTPQNTPSSPVDGRTYTDTDGTEFMCKDGGYYKVEGIAWRVLKNADGKLFLLSEKNLDAGKPYHNTSTNITWEQSTIRSWLNGYTANQAGSSTANPYSYSFMNWAFSAEEQAAILTTDVVNDNDNNPGNGENGTLTNDKIFLLSIQEAINPAYGFTDNYNATDTRKAVNTGYTAHFSGMYGAGVADFWWLRSPGITPYAAIVYDSGLVIDFGYFVDYAYSAARPAFNLDLSSVIFTSAAVGGKSAPAGANLIPAEPVVANLKFTVKDENLTLGSVTHTGIAGNTVSFAYTGASEGKTLSAVVLSDSGAVKYYGKLIDNITSASGSATVTVPDSLAATDTMQIFVEECNGDYLTDFASGYKKLDIAHSLTKTNAVAATCETAGNSEYWTCTDCGKHFSDEDGDNVITANSWIIPALGHSLTKTNAVAATCETAGNSEYWTCSVCGKHFSDEDGDNEITANSWVIAATGHDWATAWTSDTSGHWHECGNGCNEKGSFTAHTPGEWIIDTPATATIDGSRHKECDVCGYVTETEVIPGGVNYIITEGANSLWKKGTANGVIIKSNGEYAKFTGVMLDGVLIDPANYISQSGSTVVTLKPEYLETLTVGEHTIEFLFTDGSVKTNLTILAADVVTPTDPTPGTGDNSNMTLWLLLGGASFILMCGTIAGRKKYKAVKR